MKNFMTKTSLILVIHVGLFALATPSNATVFNNGGGDNFWGNNANWVGDAPDGVGASATIPVNGSLANQFIILADNAGNDQSFTVSSLGLAQPNAGGASSHNYQINNVSGGTASLIFQASSGNATLTFGNTFSNPTIQVNTGIILNSNLSINVLDNTGDNFRINGDISGSNGIQKGGIGTLLLNGATSYTGDTTIANGELRLGAADRIADTSNLVLDGGDLQTDGFSETLGTLLLSDDSVINLGSGDSDLVFSASNALSWTTATLLEITNFDEGVDSIRFGTDATGLTETQLSQITLNGEAVSIDDGGFLSIFEAPVSIPEPSSFALLGAFSLGLVMTRRRK